MSQHVDVDVATVRFYEWCVRDATAEQAAGYPFYNLFNGFGARGFLYLAEKLAQEQQKQLLQALVRRRHERALQLSGESLSPTDKEWIAYWRQDRIMPPLTDRPVAPGEKPVPMLSAKEVFRRLRASSDLPVAPDAITRNWGTIIFDWEQRGLTVRTAVDVGGRSQQASFLHFLLTSGGVRIVDGTDPLRWAGVGGAQWIHVRATQADMVVDTVAQSLKRFASAVDFITG